ncbi:MAG TPA: sigma-54 dependent transcriptional regulator [Rectinemataceae bacterium]|nr:sigma-54 dependent transcriptional regulator [Rectinemataceae bacterium]
MSERPYPAFPIAIVDDEEYTLVCVEDLLRAEGITNVLPVRDPKALPALIEESSIGLVLLDLALPGMDGRELLALIRRDHPQVAVIVITGNRDIERAVECMRLGASDYLTKPVDGARMVISLRHLIEMQELVNENLDMRDRLLSPRRERSAAFGAITTAGQTMGPILDYAEMIAPSSHPVLITGETGVGKELFAKAIHDQSGREGDFVAVNVAGLDDAFFSDLLFGHRAGAYTGSQGGLEGLIERANNGSLFLDEIGDLSHSSQVKLLRVIESGEYYPLGSDLLKRSKARIIVATNRDLRKALESGEFRKDLFFRLNGHRLHIPPLRERKEDIPFLVERFFAESAVELSKKFPSLPPELSGLLRSHDFPGNVRELRAMIFDAVNCHKGGVLSLRSFKEAIDEKRRTAVATPAGMAFPCPLPTLKELSGLLFDEALRRADGNQSLAARLLGISPQAVSKRLKAKQTKADNLG